MTKPTKYILARVLHAADQGAPLYEGADSGKTYTTRHRAFAYTAVITMLTVFVLVIGGMIDPVLTVMFYVHIVTLVILLIVFAAVAMTRYRPGEGALLTITLLDALAFSLYGFVMTTHFFTLFVGLWLTVIASIVAFGCLLVFVLGFALLAR